jgi:hypothetical protein
MNAIPLETPATVDRMDFVITVSFSYRTSPGDAGTLSLDFQRYEPGAPTRQLARPGDFSLSPSIKTTSTTVTWLARDVKAGGRKYAVGPLADLQDNGDGVGFFRTSKMSVIIDGTRAGPY